MKKLLFSGFIALAAITVTGCGNKSQQVTNYSQDSTYTAPVEKPTIYGIVAGTTTNDTLMLMIDSGDTLNIDLTAARQANHVMGTITAGDRMIVLTNVERTAAEVAINQNMLLGDWVMPDPIQSVISYRTWRIVDGQIEIVSIRDGGGQEEETNYYDIVKLTKDSLTYQNDEDTFEYSRQKPNSGYGRDIKLEESSYDDFAM